MYGIGLVVGKFCPLHLGHQLLIDTAAEQCEHVIIVSYTSRDLGYPAFIREEYLQAVYGKPSIANRNKFRIIVLDENSPGMPDDDAPDIEHREFCAQLVGRYVSAGPDAVFSSELYGQGFADHLSKHFKKNVDHVCVDLRRDRIPVSGTALRSDKQLLRQYTSPEVQQFLPKAKRILFIGGESSGKTTLASAMAKITGHPWVPEYGRELYEAQGNHVDFEDMVKIAREQIRQEEAASELQEYVFCDTSPLVTRFYSEKWFGKCDPGLRIMSERTYDKIYFCNRDFDFVDDGSRNGEVFSDEQALYYDRFLGQRGEGVTNLYGSINDRIQQVLGTYEDETYHRDQRR